MTDELDASKKTFLSLEADLMVLQKFHKNTMLSSWRLWRAKIEYRYKWSAIIYLASPSKMTGVHYIEWEVENFDFKKNIPRNRLYC